METSSPKKCLGNHLNRYSFTLGTVHHLGTQAGITQWAMVKNTTVENDGRDDKI
jgi:hypothetical protein